MKKIFVLLAYLAVLFTGMKGGFAQMNDYLAPMERIPDQQQCLTLHHSGNIDSDFIHSMIPHHQLALAMAEKEMQDGKNPAARAMAQKIYAAEKNEIEQMEDWLKSGK